MGRMLKLMGNASPTRQEAFLTLMERGMRRGEVGGRARFTDSQTPAELQWSSLPPWNFSHPSCLPSFFPFTALQHHSQAFAFLLSAPPPKGSHRLAFNTSSRPLSVSLSDSTNPLLLATLPSCLFAFTALAETLARIKIIFYISSYVSVCASGPSLLCLWVLLFAVNYIRSETLLHSWRSILTFSKSSKMDEWQKKS